MAPHETSVPTFFADASTFEALCGHLAAVPRLRRDRPHPGMAGGSEVGRPRDGGKVQERKR